jgi:predicted regulator of Ras-like GTPase activity (Roadblock/LC7/MglB family)
VVDALENNGDTAAQPSPEAQVGGLSNRLEGLRREIGAQCVLVSTADATLVAQAGAPTGLDLEQLLQLTASHFSTSLALAQYLGGTHIGNLTYYEGASHDVYMANVEEDLYLVMVFDRRVQASRIGIVWLYARRAIEGLRRLRTSVP